MHLVVDDQAPVSRVEQLEMWMHSAAPRRDHLIRRDSNRANLLLHAGILADLIGRQCCSLDQLVMPLPGSHSVRDQDQSGGAGSSHRGCAHDRLTGTAGQYHYTRAAVPEGVGGLCLIGTQRPLTLIKADCVRLTVDI